MRSHFHRASMLIGAIGIAAVLALASTEALASTPTARGCPATSYGPCADQAECVSICEKELPGSIPVCSMNCCFCFE